MSLTESQENVLFLTMVGLSVEEIADHLGLTERQARHHSDRLRAMFNVPRRRNLIAVGDRVLSPESRAVIRARIETKGNQ